MSTEFEHLKVLIVDDYEIMSQQLCKIFKQFGLTIFEAVNGVEALEVLRKEKVDVVFTDIVMPVMDGFELCEEIRKSSDFFDLPIVVLSTHCDANYIIKALRQGADDYIPKPVKAPIVKKVLKRVLKNINLKVFS